MKIAILSMEPNNHSTRRLVEEGRARGHTVRVLETLRCYMNIASGEPTVHYKGKELAEYDAVIPRIGESVTSYGTALVRQFEMMGTMPVNSSIAITRSRDKLRSMQLLSREGIGMPRTVFAHNADDIPDLLAMAGEEPLIIKLVSGTQGAGVVKADTLKQAESMVQAFMATKSNILVQEFIEESSGTDIRCFVVDGKVVAAMKRTALEGEFRSNLHRGGVAELVQITKEERETAIKAAKIMGLTVAGVDILRSNHGPLVIEVNSSPGLKGIETASGENVAGKIYDYIECKSGAYKHKTKVVA